MLPVVPVPYLVVVAQPSLHLLVHLMVNLHRHQCSVLGELASLIVLPNLGTLVWVLIDFVLQILFGGSISSPCSLRIGIERWLLLLLCGLVG